MRVSPKIALQFVSAVILSASAGSAYAQADTARGEQLYVDCIACHAIEENVHDVGPSLGGMFGRAAGAVAEFRYSPALSRSGIIWTSDTLNAFIADPQRAVPTNRMPYSGMPNAQDRADLIAYLMDVTE